MSPIPGRHPARRPGRRDTYLNHGNRGRPTTPEGLVLEAWSEGYMVGSLIILICVTISNMRRECVLHKLILVELLFGIVQGLSILFSDPLYAWWLSVGAIFLNTSWSLHNVIAWMKLKPFLSPGWSRFFIASVILAQPYWVLEIYANFAYFHNINDLFLHTRPWEALCRDPWWIAAAVVLLYNIKTKYELSARQIAHISPRFVVMVLAMMLSIVFIIVDILSVTDALASALPVGINPFWKLSFVFKCLTDAVVLDDFKTALDRLRTFKIRRLGSIAGDPADSRYRDPPDVTTIKSSTTGWADVRRSHEGPPGPASPLPGLPGHHDPPTRSSGPRTGSTSTCPPATARHVETPLPAAPVRVSTTDVEDDYAAALREMTTTTTLEG